MDLDGCDKCEYQSIIQSSWKNCIYCKQWSPKENVPNTICLKCLERLRNATSLEQRKNALKKGRLYLCTSCHKEKRPPSFPKGSGANIESLVCKVCITNRKISSEGKKRCSGCGSVFPLSEIHWNKYCPRCLEKNKKWNIQKQRELRKDPKWIEYYHAYSKYYYWNVVKPIYNRTLALQWAHGYARKRNYDRGKGWYMLNHMLFEDFKNRPGYWYSVTQQALTALQKGGAAADRILNRLSGNYKEY